MGEVLLLDHFAVTNVEEVDGARHNTYNTVPFFASTLMGGIPKTINVLPKPGRYTHKIYGTVVVDRASNEEFITNFNNGVYDQQRLPIDVEHQLLVSGAAGYMMAGTGRIDEYGAGWVDVEWNDRGIKLLSGNRFSYFSPSWFRKWIRPEDEQTFNNVLVGGALTNQPYYKEKALKPLFASELYNSSEEDKKEDMPENNLEQNSNPVTTPPSITPEQYNLMMEQFAEIKAENEKRAKENEELNKRLEFSNAELAKTNELNRIRHFSEIIRGIDQEGDGSPTFKGDASVHGAVLNALAQVYSEDSEEFRNYVAHERSVAAQLDESELIKTKGGAGSHNPSQASSATNEWFAEAGKIMTEQKVTEVQAFSILAQRNPTLYNKYRKESYASSKDSE